MRIQLELPKENVEELRALMKEADIETYKQLFKDALSLLYWSVKEAKKGRIIASVDDQSGKYREVVMPTLQTVAARAAAARREEEAAVR